MIWESCYWKEPLLESALRLSEYSGSESLDESQLVQIEKDIFVGFYTIRKLMDTVKITDSTRDLKVQIDWSPNIKQVDLLNNHRIDELYDLNKVGKEERKLKFICDQIVHSYIFMPEENEYGGLAGFYFTSDKDRQKKIFYIAVQGVIDIFNVVGNDYPSGSEYIRNPETGEFYTRVW
ncbi:hypothetical protein [Chrysiogenes arsenatis]|uniref:hypothetical protein n=1 Tax=Chrysiogenes arsenatis TaxID=309797 RepID=UPI0004877869|nr:hypothetical protein [Chrysiogenes arsenatis]